MVTPASDDALPSLAAMRRQVGAEPPVVTRALDLQPRFFGDFQRSGPKDLARKPLKIGQHDNCGIEAHNAVNTGWDNPLAFCCHRHHYQDGGARLLPLRPRYAAAACFA